MGSIGLEGRNRELILILSIGTLMAAILLSGSIMPLNRNAVILFIWLLIVPISYRILAEQETMSTGIFELPGIPAGSKWQPRAPRAKRVRKLSRRERAARDLNRLLKKLGYSSNSLTESHADMIACSPDGRNFVVKLLDGEAGVLACQDAMKAMLDNDAQDAIMLAPRGSTSRARRFIRKIRSRRGLHIRICNDAQSIRIPSEGK